MPSCTLEEQGIDPVYAYCDNSALSFPDVEKRHAAPGRTSHCKWVPMLDTEKLSESFGNVFALEGVSTILLHKVEWLDSAQQDVGQGW